MKGVILNGIQLKGRILFLDIVIGSRKEIEMITIHKEGADWLLINKKADIVIFYI